MRSVFFSLTIFLGAFLLFTLEPLIARQILPWFGGSAAVWSTCLVFYQTALLAGYLYAALLSRLARFAAQAAIHSGVLLVALFLLPIGPNREHTIDPKLDPRGPILSLLTAAIGLPFVVLSATSPLLQSWLARRGERNPYGLFAVSNFASLAALLCFPLLIEPRLDTTAQRLWWSGAFVVFVALCMGVSLLLPGVAERSAAHGDRPLSSRTNWPKWFSLAACGSMLLLSVTNHLDENVAPVPLLWVLPLSVYLLSFVVGFGLLRNYNRGFWLRALAFSLGIIGYATYNINAVEAIQVNLPIFLAGLFVCCTFCHAELNRSRPEANGLTVFYLLIAAGGAAGAIFVGLVAPRLFSGVYELPLSLIATALLALVLCWNHSSWAMRGLWIATAACMSVVMATNVSAYHENALTLRRSFYGSLRVIQTPHAGPGQQRILFHGTVEHGAQFLLPPKRSRPTTYYGPGSGIGILLRECLPTPRRVAIVGLGAGTLAAYGKAGDVFHFYEINEQIIELAQVLFFYLRETPASIHIVPGDARLSLAREASSPFDLIVLDAFSGDAIPVHLLTREAVSLYLTHLRANGVLAFHISNNYLDLAPVVAQLTEAAGLHTLLVHSHRDDDNAVLPADWVIATQNEGLLTNPALELHAQPIASRRNVRPWTDEYNNLLQVFKTPELGGK